MAEPIKWRSKTILVKPEPLNAYGVDAVPTAAANAMLLTNVQLQPMEGQEVSRDLELPYLGAQEQVPVGLYSVLSGDFELVGSGTAGVAPAWGPLLRACGAAEVVTPATSVEYWPISDNIESCSVYIHIGPNRYIILGAEATAECTVGANGIPKCRVTITGLLTVPSAQSRPTPVLTAWKKPKVASKANTPTFSIGGVPFVLREFRLNLGNDVQPRMLIGSERIMIVDKDEQLSCTVEAVSMATYNPVAQAMSPAPSQAIVLQHDTVAGRIVKIEAGYAVQQRFGGPSENQKIEEWALGFKPLPSAGNDQWKITLT